jgi:hypothetical protein
MFNAALVTPSIGTPLMLFRGLTVLRRGMRSFAIYVPPLRILRAWRMLMGRYVDSPDSGLTTVRKKSDGQWKSGRFRDLQAAQTVELRL